MPSIILSNVFDYQAILDTQFSAFLIKQHASEITRKNYITDCKHFFAWLETRLSNTDVSLSLPDNTPLGIATTEFLEEYKRSQSTAHVPITTINRRLSALRMFFQFAELQHIIRENPMHTVHNLSRNEDQNQPERAEQYAPTPRVREPSLFSFFEEEFLQFLKRQQLSAITIKNYIVDIRVFFNWLNNSVNTGKIALQEAEKPLQRITGEIIDLFKQSISMQTPTATINRRLSALRMFFQFALIEHKIMENPMLHIRNISRTEDLNGVSTLDAALKHYAGRMNASPADIEDIKTFFSWYSEQYIS